MNRRHLLIAAAGATLASASYAQPAAKTARVGFLIAGDAEPHWSLYRKAMRELGYVEGQSIEYEYRPPEAGRSLDERAASLVAANVNVIVAVLTPAITAASKATSRIPIVFNGGAVETGLVKNLTRPEGNMTGVRGATAALAGKGVQLLQDITPTKAIGLLLNASDPFHMPLRADVEAAAAERKIEVVALMLRNESEYEPAVELLAQRGVSGLLVQPSLVAKTAADLAIQHRLPSVSFRRPFADAGGLAVLGADQPAINRLLAGYVDRVLKGTPIVELPIQQATRYELIVNQRTAKAIGLTLSALFLAQADEVIE